MSSEIIEKQMAILKAVISKVEEVAKERKEGGYIAETCLAVYAEVNKDLRMIQIQNDRAMQRSNGTHVPATEPQLKYLKDHNLPHDKHINKNQAWNLISQHKGGS